MKSDFVINEIIIPSPDVRKFINNINWKFTDREIAAMIYNNEMYSPAEAVDNLRDYRDYFTDEKTITEIDDEILYDNFIRDISKESESDCVFVLWLFEYDDQYGPTKICNPENLIFSNHDAAYQVGKKVHPKHGFEIMKYRIFHTIKDFEFDETNSYLKTDNMISSLLYDSDGNLKYYSYNLDITERFPNSIYSCIDEDLCNRFENQYVLIPNPFKVGDIVYDITLNKVGVIRSDFNWEEFKDIPINERCERLYEYGDFGDAQYSIDILDKDIGMFGHHHSLITCLRYANDDDYESKEEKYIYMKESINAKIGIGDLSIIDKNTIYEVTEANNKLIVKMTTDHASRFKISTIFNG